MQLEVEHTVSLHLRSRRVGSDEAVYSTVDLLSTLLARLGGRSEEIFEGASPGRRMRHAVIQQALSTAIGVLQSSPMAHLVGLHLYYSHLLMLPWRARLISPVCRGIVDIQLQWVDSILFGSTLWWVGQ